MTKVKVLKATNFVAKGEQHTHYAVALKGRTFGVSTLAFDKGDLVLGTKEVDDKGVLLQDNTGLLLIKGDLEVSIRKETDVLTGVTEEYKALVPKLNLTLGM
jgi:hypothetical protein